MELLKERDMLKSFQLESVTGGSIDIYTYKGKQSLVLVFFGTDCSKCNDFLSALASRYDEYKSADAEILAIGEGTDDRVREIAHARSLPFPVLADPEGSVLSLYSTEVPAVFVADRFGEVRMTSLSSDDAHLPNQERLLTALQLAQLECPECGISTWL